MGRRNKNGRVVDNGIISMSTRPPNGQSSTGGRSEVDMTMVAELRDLLGKIETATREGHELLKDLRIESRRAQRILPMIVTERIRKEVERQFKLLADETEQAMRRNVEKVGTEFDRLADILLGRDRESLKQGRRTIPDIIQHIADSDIPLPLEPEPGELPQLVVQGSSDDPLTLNVSHEDEGVSGSYAMSDEDPWPHL
jgi:hypothetical protein